MTMHRRSISLAPLLTVLLLPVACGGTKTQEGAAPAAIGDAQPGGDIQLFYKRDPRVIDPYRGLGPWATGPSYTGAAAQDTVETRARAVDSKGAPFSATLEWIPSDPGMVTVSPARGEQVTITVHRAGESQLKVNAGGLSKELTVRANYEGNLMVLGIAPRLPAKASGSDAKEMNPALPGKREQVSYAVGMDLARTLRKQSVAVDADILRQGFMDVLSGSQTMMNDDQAHAVLVGVVTEINLTDAGFERKQLAERNREEGEDFLAENRTRDGVVALPSGLQYKVINPGNGRKPTLQDVAICHYRGMFLDGREFDNSHNKKTGEPVAFPVKGVISGWQEALQLMPAGAKWQLFVPPNLAYGERGAPRSKIGPNTALMFEIELLSVEPGGTARPRTGATYQPAKLPSGVLEQLEKVAQGRATKTGATANAQETGR